MRSAGVPLLAPNQWFAVCRSGCWWQFYTHVFSLGPAGAAMWHNKISDGCCQDDLLGQSLHAMHVAAQQGTAAIELVLRPKPKLRCTSSCTALSHSNALVGCATQLR
jgi:hypothetical protein